MLSAYQHVKVWYARSRSVEFREFRTTNSEGFIQIFFFYTFDYTYVIEKHFFAFLSRD